MNHKTISKLQTQNNEDLGEKILSLLVIFGPIVPKNGENGYIFENSIRSLFNIHKFLALWKKSGTSLAWLLRTKETK